MQKEFLIRETPTLYRKQEARNGFRYKNQFSFDNCAKAIKPKRVTTSGLNRNYYK